MQVTKKDLEKSQIELTVEIPWQDMQPYIDKAVEKISAEVKIQGFRPGKASFDILKQKVGDMPILEEAGRIAINKTIAEAVEKNIDKQPIGQPHVNITKLAFENPMEYKAVFSFLPEVKLKKYKDLGVKPEKAEILDEEIQKTIDYLKENQIKEVLKEGKVEENDKVLVDIEMFQDNVPVEGGQSQGTAIVIGKDYLIPGFDKKIIGAKKEDERKFDLVYPENHYQKNLAGKKVDFKVKIKEIYERQMPEENDELAQKFGMKSLEELKKNLRENLTKEKEQEARQKEEGKILTEVVKNTEFGDIPEVLVDQEVAGMMEQWQKQIESQGGNFEDYLASIKKTKEDMAGDMRPEAEKKIKAALVIRQIAIDEKITPTEKQIEEKRQELIDRYQGYEKVVERVKEKSYTPNIENMIINEKVIEKLRDWNLVK